MDETKTWRTYEEVATYILNRFASEFGMTRFEGKQDIDGEATTWEIDAKGIRDDDCAFLVVECKCHKSRIHQGILGNLAFSIIDAGGTGGVIVSPMDLQKGAKKIAASQNIVHVKLPANSTPENFIIKFLNKVFAQLTDKLVVSDVASCEVVPTRSR